MSERERETKEKKTENKGKLSADLLDSISKLKEDDAIKVVLTLAEKATQAQIDLLEKTGAKIRRWKDYSNLISLETTIKGLHEIATWDSVESIRALIVFSTCS